MLVFSARLIVNESLTRDVLIGLVTAWLNNSHRWRGKIYWSCSSILMLQIVCKNAG